MLSRGSSESSAVRAPVTSPEAARRAVDRTCRLEAVERLVTHAARQIKPLSTLTPVDVRAERERLAADLAAGRRPEPRWTYAPRAHDDLVRALSEAELALAASVGPSFDAAEFDGEDDGLTPVEGLYLERIRELIVEAQLCAAAGTKGVAELARARFGASDAATTVAARELCRSWLEDTEPVAAQELVRSDDGDPRSLLSRMRAAVGRLRLPFSVVPVSTLSPVAATGEHVILISTARYLSDEDTRRTVVHEIEGHARPRARSLQVGSGPGRVLFRAGTARGADDQEGRAILIEHGAGLLGPRRRRELAARYRAVEAMLEGADFAEVVRLLVDQHGIGHELAIVVAERAFRGGDGVHPGLGRERIYIEAFVRVRGHLAAFPEDDAVLASGQVAVSAVGVLRSLCPEADWAP